MQYGLNQVDLNLRAQLAIAGFSRTPEADISALLRSGQPIEERTRLKLADALDGKVKGFRLRGSNTAKVKGLRAFQTRREWLRIGRLVGEQMPRLKYEDAVARASAALGISVQSISAHVAFAKKVAKAIDALQQRPDAADLDLQNIEFVVLYAFATKQKPADCLRPSAQSLGHVVEALDALKAAARGLQPDRQTHSLQKAYLPNRE